MNGLHCILCCLCVAVVCALLAVFFAAWSDVGFFFFWLTFKEKELWASVVDVSVAM